jgi:hypothetical protein
MYSHNYPHLLRSSGYALFRQHVEPIDPAVRFYEMVVMVATSAPVAAPQESFACLARRRSAVFPACCRRA